MSLVWDFYREIGSDTNVKPCGIVHYYDETAQTLFLNGGLKTRLSAPEGGQWETAVLSQPSQFINKVDYSALSIDHPANGTLYMAAIEGGNLKFLRYVYASDLSGITSQVTFTAQADNPITQISASIKNVSNELFNSNGTLFNPGAKLALGIAFGDSEVYPIGVSYMDDFGHDSLDSSVSISGRNAIGYFLKEATFGSASNFTGTFSAIGEALANLAGVKKFQSQTGTGDVTITVKPNNTILSGFSYLNDVVYYNSNNPMRLAELADGTVINGSESYLANYAPNTFYTFDIGKDLFKRKTKKSVDGAYAGVYVTGKDSVGAELTPVELSVPNYSYWQVPAKKLKHIAAPEGWVATQPDLQWFAEQKVKELQYIGIGEDFTGPLRPHLLVGDVAEITEDGGNTATTLGVITEVKHTLGEKGFSTAFSVDSGGEYTVIANGIRSTVSAASGNNRRQRMTDIIKIVSGK